MEEVRSIVYVWWRKSELEKGFIKFGDHTEPLSNKNWLESTKRYIQKSAAPKESKIFEDIIGYEILDATSYAKKINKNYKLAKIDNTISRIADLDKYRLGQTDQFKLPKFQIDVDEFIDIIKETIYGGKNFNRTLPLTNNFTISTIKELFDNKTIQLSLPTNTKELDSLCLAKFFEANKILILSKNISQYDNIINSYFEFNNFIVRHNLSYDGQFSFADKKILISDLLDVDQKEYDFIIDELSNIDYTIFYYIV